MYEENVGRTRDASARWATVVGTREHERARNVAIDSIGDVVVVGDQTQPTHQSAAFITKRVASDGSERWIAKFMPLTVGSQADAKAVAVGPNDSVIVGGYFQGIVDFAGTTLDASDPLPTTEGASFVAKLSTTGDVQWVQMLDHIDLQAVAAGLDGRTYITGSVRGALSIAGTMLTTSAGDRGAVLIALGTDGVPLWGRAMLAHGTGDGGTFGAGVTIAPDGDVIVAGAIVTATELGGPILSPPAGARSAAFVTRFRSDGLYLASSIVPAPGWDTAEALSIAVDPAGATVVTSLQQNPAAGNAVRIVHVLDEAQDQQWEKQVDGPISFTADGAMLSANWIDDRAVTQGGALELATVDASGVTWSTALGERIVNAPRGTGMRAAVAGPDGGVAIVGELTGTIDIADTELAAVGGQQDDIDALMIMVDP